MHFDLALVDYSLANGSRGAEAVQLLRERYSSPSIFVSDDLESCRKAREQSGALGCLQRPFTDIDLLRAVEIAEDQGLEAAAHWHVLIGG
jgi:CheY-like chemotaxis protein